MVRSLPLHQWLKLLFQLVSILVSIGFQLVSTVAHFSYKTPLPYAFFKKSEFLEEGGKITKHLTRNITNTVIEAPLPPWFLKTKCSGHRKYFKCVFEFMAKWGSKKRKYQIPACRQFLLSSHHCCFPFFSAWNCVCVCACICASVCVYCTVV